MIRILHTADWHLGQTFFGYDRVEEHAHFLQWLARELKENKIDVLLVAGDVFDVSNPSAASQRMFYHFIRQVTEENPKLQLVVVAGNHDSAARLEAPLPLLQEMRTEIRGIVRRHEGEIDYDHLIVELKNSEGEVEALCLAVPFLRQGDYPVDMKILMNIILLSLLSMSIMSCHDNDDVEPLVQLNKYRAKEIKGHNALWGDFKISLNYIDNSLDLGFITDRNQDTIGRLNSSQVLMLVPSISQEEIDQLEPGSTIPMKYQVIFQIQRKTNQEVIYHYAKEDLQYVLKYSESYLFEYDDTLRMDRKIMKWRRIGDSKTDDPLMRMVYTYNGDRLTGGEYATYISNWEPRSHVEYSYDGNQLTGIKETTIDGQVVFTKTFIYSGSDRLKVKTEDHGVVREVDYVLNSDGYVTRIDEGDGNYMEVEYELGHGDLSTLVSNIVKIQGEPFIK